MLSSVLNNIENYLNHTKTRKCKNTLDSSHIIYEESNLELYKFCCSFSTNQKILIIPSLINGPEILCLNNDWNFIKFLKGKGDVYLVKWKNINDHNRNFDINSYVLDVVKIMNRLDGKITLIGHCLGGIIAFGASYLNQSKILQLVLLTTPWNFSHFYYNDLYFSNTLLENYQEIPAIFLEMMFFMRDPTSLYERFDNFANTDIFLEVENWLHSGNNMAKNAYSQLMNEFVVKNSLVNKEWKIMGNVIDPELFKPKTLILNCKYDKIVPASSSTILHELLPNSDMQILNSGHIGFLLGKNIDELSSFLRL